MKLKKHLNEVKSLEDKDIIDRKGLVSLTIKMPINRFKELESELGIKNTMGLLNPDMHDSDFLSIIYVSYTRKGYEEVTLKDNKRKRK